MDWLSATIHWIFFIMTTSKKNQPHGKHSTISATAQATTQPLPDDALEILRRVNYFFTSNDIIIRCLLQLGLTDDYLQHWADLANRAPGTAANRMDHQDRMVVVENVNVSHEIVIFLLQLHEHVRELRVSHPELLRVN